MEEKTESERVRSEVAQKCVEMGIKKTRHLSLSEGKAFLATGLFPATALGKSTFAVAKRLEKLPSGFSCMCCGIDLGGKPGWVVEIVQPDGKSAYRNVCPEDYEVISGGGAKAEADASAAQAVQAAAMPTPASVQATPAAPANSVEAALKALTVALATPKPPPIDGKKIVADAVAEAVKAAKDEAKGFMQKSIAEFIKDGTVPAQDEANEAEAKRLKGATGDGVDAAEKAMSWTAKATVQAKDAVEKLTKFLSEFSYFRCGVSMRLINTFARSADKLAILQSYCEISQMEDINDLVEKMKSPEFKAVCDAFKPFKPKPLNKRFAVFYGNPGGGKTFAAEKAGKAINGDGKCDMVICHAGMDSADMLYAYRLDYATGKRGYVPTALLSAMVNGRAVVLDEVNTLPMEARMFLQDILDNKGCVHVMGVEIPIRDGFFILGTMNPETGLGPQPLPLPLVDRAAVIREFRTSAVQAAVGAGLC